MRSDEAILDEIIKDGSVDISEWPELLKRFLTRLEHIAHNSFPTPPPASNPAPPSTIPATNPSTQSTAPDAPSPPSETPAEAPAGTSSNESTLIPDAPAAAAPAASPPSMPPPPATTTLTSSAGSTDPIAPDDLETLTQLTTILTTSFDNAPPYTIQRLAELLRNPTAHYRSLKKYLRALTRVLSVSSPTTVFPLEDTSTSTVPNGAAFMLGSDESLGGALLSPIPWLTPTTLSEETTAPDGTGVTQGELMRAEQELGIVPVVETQEATPPPPLGPEDVGPQPEGTTFADPPGVEEMGRVEEMRDASVEREEREETLEDKMQLDAAADGKEEEEARKEKEKEKSEEKEEEAKDEKMAEA